MTRVTPKTQDAAPHFVVCTARYSPNLGDGVIAETEEYLLKQVVPNASVVHLDIAGRQHFDMEQQGGGLDLHKVFRLIPKALQPVAMRLFFKLRLRNRLQAAWDAIDPEKPFYFVLGGGHLFSDLALNFPLKMNFFASLVMDRADAAAVTSVGVGPKWSQAARQLVSAVTRHDRLAYVSVRDETSRGHWLAHLGGKDPQPRTTIDPAICCSDVYPTFKKRSAASKPDDPRVGLGVTLPQELAAYASALTDFSDSFFTDYWSDLAGKLSALGCQPVFFTNGTTEDEDFLDRLLEPAQMARYERLKRPLYPAELAGNITGCDAIVSHRLHASVIAYAFDIPSLLLDCDPKLQSFAKATRREDFLIPNPLDAERSAQRVMEAMTVGIDQDFKASLVHKVHQEFETMLDLLKLRADR